MPISMVADTLRLGRPSRKRRSYSFELSCPPYLMELLVDCLRLKDLLGIESSPRLSRPPASYREISGDLGGSLTLLGVQPMAARREEPRRIEISELTARDVALRTSRVVCRAPKFKGPMVGFFATDIEIKSLRSLTLITHLHSHSAHHRSLYLRPQPKICEAADISFAPRSPL